MNNGDIWLTTLGWCRRIGHVGGAIIGIELANCILPTQMNTVCKAVAKISAAAMCSDLAGRGVWETGNMIFRISKYAYDATVITMNK